MLPKLHLHTFTNAQYSLDKKQIESKKEIKYLKCKKAKIKLKYFIHYSLKEKHFCNFALLKTYVSAY